MQVQPYFSIKEDIKVDLDEVMEKYVNLENYVKHLEIEIKKLQEENKKERLTNDNSDKEKINDSKYFQCDQCDFVSKTIHGLKTHKGKKHEISQLDGNLSIEIVENEAVT